MKKLLAITLSALLLLSAIACISSSTTSTTSTTSEVTQDQSAKQAVEVIQTEEPKAEVTEEPKAETTEEPKTEEPQQSAEEPAPEEAKQSSEPVRVAALVGPTGMGLAYLTQLSDAYTLDLYTAPDQVTAKVINGEVDIAAVPVNLGSVLYNKTSGGVTVIAVNTLGVLYFVENGDTVHSIEDLKGKTVYSTGQGSTPQYILEKILSDNGLTEDVKVEYLAENTELVAKLLEDNEVSVAFLPEPQVSNACIKGENCRVALSANELWSEKNDTDIVQGIYIVRTEYLKEHADKVDQFILDAGESAKKVTSEEGAPAVLVEAGIIGAEPIAKRAIPNANIVLKSGTEMQQLVEKMLTVLFTFNPQSVGGKMPETDFYYAP